MTIDLDERQDLSYFIGTEVEHSIMRREPTLFIVGIKPINEILDILRSHNNKLSPKDKHVQHLYFGTSQSFNPKNPYDWEQWDHMITPLLRQGHWVTLDFDVKYAEQIHDEGWCEFKKFVPMISVKIPYIKLFNYHTTLKIDDKSWGVSNTGVWCHPLNELLRRDVYTDWKDYHGDTAIFPEEKNN
jgi:hypothetical protein